MSILSNKKFSIYVEISSNDLLLLLNLNGKKKKNIYEKTILIIFYK